MSQSLIYTKFINPGREIVMIKACPCRFHKDDMLIHGETSYVVSCVSFSFNKHNELCSIVILREDD